MNPFLPSPPCLQVPLIYGCMNVCGTPRAPKVAPHESIIAAFEAGFRLFDHADIYRAGACEEAHARAARECPELARSGFVITKAGHVFPPHGSSEPHHYNTEPSRLVESARRSRDRLGVGVIDLFLIHRPDPLLDPVGVAEAFLQMKEEKIAAHFGVSNFLPWQCEALQAHLPDPLYANQVQFHPGRLEPMFDGTFDYALARGMVPMAWGPLNKGAFATDALLAENHAEQEPYRRIQSALDEVGSAMGVTRTQAALAWIRRHPARPIPVIGTTQPERITEAWQGGDLTMDRVDWFRILIASRGGRMP